MKRTSAITQLLTVLLLAGCSQNEVTDVNPDSHPAVGFGVYTGLKNGRNIRLLTMHIYN